MELSSLHGVRRRLHLGFSEATTDTPLVREISRKLFEDSSHAGHFVNDENKLGAALAGYLAPDVSMSSSIPEIGVVHRKLPTSDIYFLANTGNKAVETKATFRSTKKYAEWFDPISGEFSTCNTIHPVLVNLQPYESRVLVFSDEKSAAVVRSAVVNKFTVLPSPIDLSTDWDVTFAAPVPFRTYA